MRRVPHGNASLRSQNTGAECWGGGMILNASRGENRHIATTHNPGRHAGTTGHWQPGLLGEHGRGRKGGKGAAPSKLRGEMVSNLEMCTQPKYQWMSLQRHFQRQDVSESLLSCTLPQEASGKCSPPKWGADSEREKKWIQNTEVKGILAC